VLKKSAPIIGLVAVVSLTALLVLATSVSSLARSSVSGQPDVARSQQITPTPTDADASVAGSTGGIMWMGIVIALIVLLPMLTSRFLWARHT
jgi:hypothetical protein